MKKLFTLIAAAFMAISASAQKEDLMLSAGWRTSVPPASGIIYSVQAWAEIGFTLDEAVSISDCKSLTVEFTNTFTGGNVMWKLYDGEGTDFVPGSFNAGESTYTLDLTEGVNKKDDDDNIIATMTDLKQVSLMPSEGVTTLQVNKFILEKKDGSKAEYIAKANSGWGVSGFVTTGTITFTGQYGGAEFVSLAGEHLAYDITAEEYYNYTIEFAEPLTNTVIIELDDADGSGFKWINAAVGDTKIEFTVDNNLSKNVGQIYLKADAGSGYPFDVIIKSLSRVKNVPLKYEATGKTLNFDDGGNIYSSEFAGYSDDAKVVFVTTVANSDGLVGWGNGKITSIGGAVQSGEIKITGEGDNETIFLLKDLKEALDSPGFVDVKDADGNVVGQVSTDSGITWTVWTCNNVCTSTRKSATIYEVEGFTGTGYVPAIPSGIQSINAEKNVNAPIYNLSGQRVDAQYKGVVIQNGKKFLQK